MTKQHARGQLRNDPKGDRRSRTISPPAIPLTVRELYSNEQNLLNSDAVYSLLQLLIKGDGWIRMTATLDMKTVYLKYKYNSGQWKGSYVMAVTTLDQLAWGICLLHEKVLQVDSAELRPCRDTFYDWKD